MKIGTKFIYGNYEGEVIENYDFNPNKLDKGEIFVGLTEYAEDGRCYSFTAIITESMTRDHK